MLPLMPRQKECVRCGNPIEGPGRIDRIYCSQTCNNAAWRLRTGKRWGGRKSPAPKLKLRDHRTRGALLRRARSIRAELSAARQLIDSLRALLAEEGHKAENAQRLLAALLAEQQQERAAWNAERVRMAAELVAAQQRILAAEKEQKRWQRLWFAECEDSIIQESESKDSAVDLLARCSQLDEHLRVSEHNNQKLMKERADLLAERTVRIAAEQNRATEADAELERVRERLMFELVRSAASELIADNEAGPDVALQARCENAEKRLRLAEQTRAKLVEERDGLSAERKQLKKQLKHLESCNKKVERALAARTQQANQLSVRLWKELPAWQEANEHNFQVATALLGGLQQANAQNDAQNEENRRLLGECHALIEVATRMDTTIRRFRWAEIRRRNQPQIEEQVQVPSKPAAKKSKARLSGSKRKRQPAATSKDKLLPVMKKKVVLERRRARKQGFFAKVGQSLLQAARAAAQQAREGFFKICGGVATAWVVKGMLLDSRSERTLLAEQKKEVLWLERQVEPIAWDAAAKRAA